MKKRKGLIAVVAALAVSSVMAAMAFTTAQVNNAMSFAVVNTNSAKVAIIENPKHVASGVAKIVDNKMVFNFLPGMQPGSSYSYDDLFYVKNNTKVPIYVGLRFDSAYAGTQSATDRYPNGLHTIIPSNEPLATYKDNIGYPNALLLGGESFRAGYLEGRTIKLEPGEQVGLDFNFIINASQQLVNKNLSLQVMARDAE